MSRTPPYLVSAIASISLLALAGCGSTPATKPAAATILYVNNYDTDNLNQIYAYSITQSTKFISSPIATLTLPANVYAGLIATDGAGNLYIATHTDIREYAAGATGLATPIRVIPMTSTTTLVPYDPSYGPVAGTLAGLAVDASGNIYVSEQGAGIAIFSSTANGNVAPTRYILGSSQPGGGLSTIQYPQNIAVNAAGNLYVSQFPIAPTANLLVFAPTANGNVAPIRTLTVGYDTPSALAVDPSGNIYLWPYYDPTYGIKGIAEFATGASGNATPVRTLNLPPLTIDGLSADPLDNLFVAYGVCGGTGEILQFSPTQSGNMFAIDATAIYPGAMDSCPASAITIH